MVIDFRDDIVDQDDYMKHFSHSQRMKRLYPIMKEAKKETGVLLANFKRTDRNKQMYIAYKFANFSEKENDGNGNIIFQNDLSFIQDFPSYISVKIE